MKHLTIKTTFLSLSTAVVLGMAGCSSSSDNNNGTSNSNTGGSTDTSLTSLSGTGVDGYLSQATVCLDLNRDGYCQIGDEPATFTKDDGSFSLTLTSAQKSTYPAYAKAPLLIYSGYDVDTGVDFTGKLKANLGDGQKINVSPLSTAVKAVMDSNKTEAQAEKLVKNMLGLPATADLKADPVKEAKTNPALLKAALKLHNTVEVLAAAKKQAGSNENANTLVDNLYKKLATQAIANQNLTVAVEKVVSADRELDADAQESATAIGGQIDLIIGDKGIADTAVIGTKIGAVKQEIVVAIENNESVPTSATLDATADTTFSLLHAKEILRIVDMQDVNTTTGTLSGDVQYVLTHNNDENMTETSFLPVDTEIKVLKADKKTFIVGAKFEDFRNAGRKAENARLEAEAKAAAEKEALEAKIKELNDQIAAADKETKAKLEADKKVAEEKAVAEEAKAKAAAQAAQAKAEADRLARLQKEADAAATKKLLDATELKKIKDEKIAADAAAKIAEEEAKAATAAAEKLAAQQLSDAIKAVGNNISTLLQTATKAQTTAVAQVAKAKKDADEAQKIANEYPEAKTAATNANNAYAVALTAESAIKDQYKKIQAAATAIESVTTIESANAELTKAQEASQAAASSIAQLSSSVTDATTALILAKSFLTNVDTSIDATAVKTAASTLYTTQTAKDGATVADAKNMFAQVRETAVTFTDFNAPENNTSTIVGSQLDTIKTKIEPAVDAIATDFSDSATALQTSTENFQTDFNADFNTTISAINSRVDALVSQTENFADDENWTVKANDDTLSHSYTVNSDGTAADTITINNQVVVTDTYKIGSNENSVSLIATTTGAVTLTGTGYKLSISDLSLNKTGAKLVASGTITGDNGAVMTLSSLSIATDVNISIDDINMFQNIVATFDGKVVAGGRSVEGSLKLTQNSMLLSGKYTGLTEEPSFDGNITLNSSINSIVNDLALQEGSSVNSWNALLMVTFSNGDKSLVNSYTQKSLHSNDESSLSEYNLTTQSGENVLVDMNDTENVERNENGDIIQYLGHTHTVTVADGATLTPYYTTDGRLTVTTDNGEKLLVDNAWYEYNGQQNDQDSFSLRMDIRNDNQGNRDLNVTDIIITPKKDMLDRTFDARFDGILTHGDKKIVASIGATRDLESKIYAKDIEITDGESSVTLDELSATLVNSEFLASLAHDDSHDNYCCDNEKSQFESYTINYDKYYNHSNDGIDFKNVLDAQLTNLQVSLYDTDNEILSLDANISIENRANITATFDGSYAYRGTKFVGHLDENGTISDLANGDTAAIGTANLFGSIQANGFAPFDIITTADFTANGGVEAYSIFTRNSTYKLAMYLKHTEDNNSDTTVVKIGDSNGVLGNFTDTYTEGTESKPASMSIVDKNGNNLATYGEDANGNNWEIKYSDNSSETLF